MTLSQIEKDARKVEKERKEAKRNGQVRTPQNIAVRSIEEPPMVAPSSDPRGDSARTGGRGSALLRGGAGVRTCGTLSEVHGAEPCPREPQHPGEHFWWVPWQLGHGWRVIVYSGTPYSRVRRCAGGFTSEPTSSDVLELLHRLNLARQRERTIREQALANPVPIVPPTEPPRPGWEREMANNHRAPTAANSAASRAARAAARSVAHG